MNENEKILKFANSLADEASRITMSYFLKDLDIVNKSDKGFDPVTIADKKTLVIKSNISFFLVRLVHYSKNRFRAIIKSN